MYPQGPTTLQVGEDLAHLMSSGSGEPPVHMTSLTGRKLGRSIPADENRKGWDQEWVSGDQPWVLEEEWVRKAQPQLVGDSRDDDISTVQVPLQQSANF